MSFLRRLARRQTLADRYLERGLYHLDKKKYDDAVADLNAAIEAEPRRAELYTARGFICLESNKRAHLKHAREDLEYALYLDSKQWVAEYCLGMMAYAEEDYNEALRHFNTADKLTPSRPEIHYYRAVCYHKLGDSSRATTEMESAIKHFEPEDRRHLDAAKWVKEFEKPVTTRKSIRESRFRQELLPEGGRRSLPADEVRGEIDIRRGRER